jgi:hypothetical protein
VTNADKATLRAWTSQSNRMPQSSTGRPDPGHSVGAEAPLDTGSPHDAVHGPVDQILIDAAGYGVRRSGTGQGLP